MSYLGEDRRIMEGHTFLKMQLIHGGVELAV